MIFDIPYWGRAGLVGAGLLALAACGSGDEAAKSESDAADAAPPPAAEEEHPAIANARRVAAEARRAAEVAAMSIDASSPEAFVASLTAMKEALTTDQAEALTEKIGELAAAAVTADTSSALDAARGLAGDGDDEGAGLFRAIGSLLDGKSFDEIMAL